MNTYESLIRRQLAREERVDLWVSLTKGITAFAIAFGILFGAACGMAAGTKVLKTVAPLKQYVVKK